MSKKVLSLVLALVMVLGTFGTAFAAAATTPTGNEKVDKLIELGLVKGYADGTYGLTQAITRAEMATMVVRALDLEAVANASAAFPSQFTDMNSANVLWARGFVNVAAGQGIVNGYPEGVFLPANNVTYAEAAAMLVRVLGGLTAAEQANAVWPTTYLAKAAQLGVFASVDGIVDYNAPATRENLFEMVFNTLTAGTDLLIANTIEGIVVENYRTETLAKDEVVVHVMKDQKAKNDKYTVEEGEEFKVVVTPELAEKGVDVETLLGKVVKVSYDKNDKVVGIEQLAGYTYVTGTIDSVTAKKIEVNEKDYTASKSESRDAADERLYQVYLNNDDVAYDELFDKKGALAEYANMTVKNGKVLFIDAYKFDDVAPVAKDWASNKVSYYDDSKDGDIRTLTVNKDSYVINFVDGVMQLGNYEDIATNDVIHFFGNTVVVRPAEDNKVEGTFERVTENRTTDLDDLTIRVEGESYTAMVEKAKRDPVYSTLASSEEFATLTKADFHAELEPFKDEEVVVLLDMFGNVQLIASETVDGSFFAIVQNRLNNEFRLYREDNESNYYDTKLKDTDFYVVDKDGRIKDAIAADFAKFDLVKATASDDLLTELNLVVKATYLPTEIYKMDRNIIQLTGADAEYLAKDAVVFTIIGSKVKAYTVADFLKAYGTKNKIEAADGIDAKIYVNTKKDLVEAIVVVEPGTITDDTITGKVKDIISSGGKYWLELTVDGVDVEYSVDSIAGISIGNIVEADVTEAKEIVGKPVVLKLQGPFEITRNRNGYLTLEDAKEVDKELFVSRSVVEFGSYSSGDKIEVLVNADGIITVINKVGSKAALGTWDGSVIPGTKTNVLEKVAVVDGKVIVTIDGKLYQYAGSESDLTSLVTKEVTYLTQTLNGVDYIYNVKAK